MVIKGLVFLGGKIVLFGYLKEFLVYRVNFEMFWIFECLELKELVSDKSYIMWMVIYKIIFEW